MARNRENKKWILFFVLTILLDAYSLEYASAFAVGGQVCDPLKCYSEDLGALQIQPGGSREVFAMVQNNVGGEDITLKAEITNGEELASLVDGNQYTVPFGDVKYKVKIRISVPEDYKDDVIVGVKFTQISPGEEQTVRFSPVIGFSFPVKINVNALEPVFPGDVDDETGKDKGKGSIIIPWAILLAVLVLSLVVVIVYFTLVNKRRRLAFPDGTSF